MQAQSVWSDADLHCWEMKLQVAESYLMPNSHPCLPYPSQKGNYRRCFTFYVLTSLNILTPSSEYEGAERDNT